jgi:PhzF family phenazine biosynthesis protein
VILAVVKRRFQQVDVFTHTPYTGNPVAVVVDGDGLSTEEMQRFANWTNLSETTFILTPTVAGADYRLRIFTASRELPFAGHPTLGSCHAWLGGRGAGEEEVGPVMHQPVIQECAAGLISVGSHSDGLAFAAPPLVRSGPVDEPLILQLAQVLRIGRDEIVDAQWVDNGPGWVAVLLADADAVLHLRPGPVDFPIGAVGPYPPGSPEAFEVRAFVGGLGSSSEDPVTGSLNASLAEWLLRRGSATAPYVASQGTVLGRSGRVRIDRDALGTIWVGGGTVTCISGEVEL